MVAALLPCKTKIAARRPSTQREMTINQKVVMLSAFVDIPRSRPCVVKAIGTEAV